MANIIINIVLYFLIIVEYISFFYVIFGKRSMVGKNSTLYFLVVANIIFLCIIICEKNQEATTDLALIISLLYIVAIYYLSWGEALSLFLVAFPLLSIIENAIGYYFNYFLHINEYFISIICMMLIIGLLWIYYLLKGKENERDAFVLPTKMNMIMSVFLFTIVAMYSYFTFALTEVIHLKMGLVGLGLVVISGMVMFFSFLSMIYYFNVQKKYQMENDILEKYNEQQKNILNYY